MNNTEAPFKYLSTCWKDVTVIGTEAERSGVPLRSASVSVLLQVSMRCSGGPGFDPWVGKLPWRRAWQATPVSLPGESHGQRSLTDAVHGLQSGTRLSDFHMSNYLGSVTEDINPGDLIL